MPVDEKKRPSEGTMWTMLMLSGLTNWATRWSVPSLVPFIASTMELTEIQRAFLLSSFFPGCASPPPAPRCCRSTTDALALTVALPAGILALILRL